MGMDAGKRCTFRQYTTRFYKVKGLSTFTSYETRISLIFANSGSVGGCVCIGWWVRMLVGEAETKSD